MPILQMLFAYEQSTSFLLAFMHTADLLMKYAYFFNVYKTRRSLKDCDKNIILNKTQSN